MDCDFHSGFFVRHPLADSTDTDGLTVIERDRNGVPCFACYFEAMFAALPDGGVDMAQVDVSELDDATIAYVVRTGAAMGYLADALGYIMARAMSRPEEIVPIFTNRLRQAIATACEDLAADGVAPYV